MKQARWPRALRILTELGPSVEGCQILALSATAAYCETCAGWRGPLRATDDEAMQDRIAHVDSDEHQHILSATRSATRRRQ
jgi:hypothetical protein